MLACVAGDSLRRNFQTVGVGIVIRTFARVAGTGFYTTVHLALTPQALCFRPLSRAGLHLPDASRFFSSPSIRIGPKQCTLAGEFDQDGVHRADEPLRFRLRRFA